MGEAMSSSYEPVSDPAADGLPETADDDSYADDAQEAARDPGGAQAPLPPDREDGPLALNDYGTTPEERLRGEPLDRRLAREQPDTGSRRPPEDPDPLLAEEVDPDAVDQLTEDTRVLAEADAVDPHLGSAISMYDRPVTGIPSFSPVGRLVHPDGGYTSHETDEIAYDVGPSAGGFGSEELAMHEIPGEQVALEDRQSSTNPYVLASLRVWHVTLR
jgi:Family of unknown function (DUF5709)